MRRISRFALSKDSRWWIYGDQLSNAALSAAILLYSSRVSSDSDLAQFALVAYLVSAAVATQRAGLLIPALASQSFDGVRREFRRSWSLTSPTVACVALAPLSLSLFSVKTFIAFELTVFFLLALDVAKFALFTRMRTRASAVIGLSAVGTSMLLLLMTDSDEPPELLLCWSGGAAMGLSLALCYLRETGSAIHFKEVARLGVWGGGDQLLSGTAGAMPLFASVNILDSSVAGTYRLLEVCLGPLRIFSSGLNASLSLSSHELSSPRERAAAVRRLRLMALRSGMAMLGVLSLVAPLVLLLSGRFDQAAISPTIVVVTTGCLIAATIPYSSFGLATGRQRFGFWLRVPVLGVSIAVLLAAQTWPFTTLDPIGVVSLTAAVTNYVGWRHLALSTLRRSRS